MGMTYEQFYDGPCNLAVAYKKAYRIKRETDNFNAYLQGAYFYKALVSCRIMFNPFSKGGKLDPWPDEPFEIFGKPGDLEENIPEKKKPSGGNEKGRIFFEGFMARHNAKMAEKEMDGATPAEEMQT